ncbi:MAG TPA: efflux RND transporter periplasmic adaptor subunit [Sedimentisphaerales bacterium]|nr:efflux RND transporter periplasmic adaptor subunit [Sedimentisphaerales bacterium]
MKPNTGSSMQDKSASQHPAIQRTGRPKRRRWLLLLVLFLIAAGAVVLVASIKGNAGAGTTSGGTFTARRDNLVITVSEGGSIRAHKSIEYRCEVESRGAQITILSIVPSGAYISQKDVEEGMVLVKLDSSSLEDQLIQEKMELASDQENETSAKEAYDIQVIQNESDVADGRLQVRFALLDLQKYLGAVLAERLTRDVNDAVDLTEYVAPFLVEVRDDPNLLDGTAAGQELKRLNDDIVLAEGNLKTAQARLAGTEKLHDANYVSELDLQGDRLTVVNREFAEQNAKVNLDLFLRYDFPKNAEQSLSDYIEAGRKLERTFAECRSRLAQAQAKLANAQERLRAQQKRVSELELQIANCTMRAKAPGLVIYGTGSTGDMFRAMRGRGGGGAGSGMIAEGETVFEGQTIISMPDTATMVAEISVHETEVDKVRPGQPATIVMDAFPDQVLHGEVLEVAPLPDQQRGFMNPDLKVYTTLVKIDGRHDFLRTRMSCRVEVLVRELDDVVIVPIQVVASRGGRKVCYVVTPQAPEGEEREVQTGAFNDTFVQIVSGLEDGEEVLLNPRLYTESAATSSFRERPQRNGSGASDANDSSAAAPAGETMGPTPATPQMPGGVEMTDEMRQQMRQFRRQGDGPGMPGGAEMTPEQRQQMMERFQRQGGGPGMPGGAEMTPEQRQQMMERFQRQGGGPGMPGGAEMTPEQRQQMMERFQRQGGGPRAPGGAEMTPEQRQRKMEMTPEQRSR